jgi:DNA phosphorothioation-dependent restriction protein DptH
MIAALPAGFGRQELLAAAAAYPFRDRRLRALALRRVELCCEHIDDRADLRALVRPGRLIVLDVRDGWLPRDRAMTLLRVLLDVLVLGEGPPPCGLLLCLDEAHKLLGDAQLRRRIEHVIRERRHLRASVILLSQDPAEVPHSTLAELDGVGLFGTGSARSIRHLARDIEVFGDLRPADAAALAPGQMLLWTRRTFSPYAPGDLEGKLVRVQVRPRLSHHGGATLPL